MIKYVNGIPTKLKEVNQLTFSLKQADKLMAKGFGFYRDADYSLLILKQTEDKEGNPKSITIYDKNKGIEITTKLIDNDGPLIFAYKNRAYFVCDNEATMEFPHHQKDACKALGIPCLAIYK